jgi:hypothetical protein
MFIDKVTITGADDRSDPQLLSRLSNKYPFVEWGILFSKTKTGSCYPSKDTRNTFERLGVPLSAHFCGQYAADIMEHQRFSLIKDLHPAYKRVQINYTFTNELGNLPALVDFARSEYAMHNPLGIILQFNKANMDVIDIMRKTGVPPNIHILHDESRGTGTEITYIPRPFWSIYTGYAGGICPITIKPVCRMINGMQMPDNVWIDMESGVRHNGRLDFNKVDEVLSHVEQTLPRSTQVKGKKILKKSASL